MSKKLLSKTRDAIAPYYFLNQMSRRYFVSDSCFILMKQASQRKTIFTKRMAPCAKSGAFLNVLPSLGEARSGVLNAEG